MAITKMAMLVAVVVGLLAMVQQSVQMSDGTSLLREPWEDLEYWAIVVSRKTSERAIHDSGDFVIRATVVSGRSGRAYEVGTLAGRHVVLLNTGKYSANVASALQSLFYEFHIRGVLYLGLAGSLPDGFRPPRSPQLRIGSVVVPKSVAFTGIWDWLEPNADAKGDLVFGHYNQGDSLGNALGSVKFNNVTLYTNPDPSIVYSQFYLETNEHWLKLAAKIETRRFQIHVGLVGASSDMTVKNTAYASFLSGRFGFSTVDQESATIALVSKTNGSPYIVFHGVSNRASGPPATELVKRRAARNAYLTLKAFLVSLPGPSPRAHLTTDV